MSHPVDQAPAHRRACALVLFGAVALAAPALAWDTRTGPGGGFEARVTAAAAVKVTGGGDAKPVLAVSCQGRGLFVTVSWPDAIPLKTNQHFVTVPWSLDGRSNTSAMLASTGSVSLAGSDARVWVRQFAAAARLEVHVPDAHGGQSASFDLAGAKDLQAGIAKSTCA